MIHDSFGCPARHVEKLQTIIREEFYKMYKGDVLAEIYEYTKSRIAGEGVVRIDEVKPLYGDLDLEQVLQVLYFFA